MSLNQDTRSQIREYLVSVMTRYIKTSLAKVRCKPFHERLMPSLSLVPFSERSFSTRLGGWFEKMAQLVALQYHPIAERNYLITGRIQPAASAHINTILIAMNRRAPRRIPNRDQDINEVLTVQSPGGAEDQVRSDLFVKKNGGEELYFEIKTPDPNKRTCMDMKRDILTIMALRKGFSAQAYAACGYNPYGESVPYADGKARQFLEIGKDILVGRPFWALIGEPDTYDELLEITAGVGREIKL